MDEALKITLPSIIGVIISLPIMLSLDLAVQDSTTMFFVMSPMMFGAVISMFFAFVSTKPKRRKKIE